MEGRREATEEEGMEVGSKKGGLWLPSLKLKCGCSPGRRWLATCLYIHNNAVICTCDEDDRLPNT